MLSVSALRPHRRRPHQDDGAVAVLVAVVIAAVLIPLTALVVDLGFARDLRNKAQTAADAAALAAAISYQADGNPTEALNQAKAYVEQNLPESADEFAACLATCVTIDDAGGTVTVDLPETTSPRVFATGLHIAARATARWAQTPAFPCWLCVQGQSSSVGLNAQEGSVVVDNGNIRVGTSDPSTLSVTSGYVKTLSGQIGYVADIADSNPPSKTTGFYSPTPGPVSPTMPTPPVLPSVTGPVSDAPDTTNGVCHPGIYRSITICTNGFTAGLFVITGPNAFTGGGSISTEPGVSFYLTCSSNGQAVPCAEATNKSGGTLSWSRDGDFHVKGPATGSRYTIAVDPDNEADQYLIDTAPSGYNHVNARLYVTGDLYAPGSRVAVRAQNWWWEYLLHYFDTGLIDVTGRITVDLLSLSGSAAKVRQHGTPPTAAPEPVPVHLIS